MFLCSFLCICTKHLKNKHATLMCEEYNYLASLEILFCISTFELRHHSQHITDMKTNMNRAIQTYNGRKKFLYETDRWDSTTYSCRNQYIPRVIQSIHSPTSIKVMIVPVYMQRVIAVQAYKPTDDTQLKQNLDELTTKLK